MNKPPRINFKHLRYFNAVAEFGSVTAAGRELHVAPQTVSAQLKELEESFERQLFDRVGRRLVLNRDGETVLRYARAIFSLGRELSSAMLADSAPQRQRLRLGISDGLPKSTVAELLTPLVRQHAADIELICQEGRLTPLLSAALEHNLDAVLSDAPPSPELSASLRVRQLSRPGMSVLARAELAARHPGTFPRRLQGMPFLLGAAGSTLALALEQWFAAHRVAPSIAGRFDDSALMKAFAEKGLGAIAVPRLIEGAVRRQHALVVVGRIADLQQSVYLIVPKRLREHPMVEQLLRDL
jgi:LysR family transcriptional regulator, transcriptional activator of nhaA